MAATSILETMTGLSRRQVVAAGIAAPVMPTIAAGAGDVRLPDRSQFPHLKRTALNNARWHPMPTVGVDAVQRYLRYKAADGSAAGDPITDFQEAARAGFARLVNADVAEVGLVPSTLVAENLVLAGLGFPATGGNVVTDALHFEGALYMYGELARSGADVRIVRPRAWRIELDDIARAIDRGTRLVAVSAVASTTGFQHDLAALCDLAHTKGALVYVDLVQAAGATPIDVRALNVDFCASASYKWLMGDMGLGFLYARTDLIGTVFKRTQMGQRQIDRFQYHLFPGDPPADPPLSWVGRTGMAGMVEVGTIANTAAAAAAASIGHILDIGVDRILRHRQPLIEQLQREVPKLGFMPLTPADSSSPIVAFAHPDTATFAPALARAGIDISVAPRRIRISPSVFTTAADIDRLLAHLKA